MTEQQVNQVLDKLAKLQDVHNILNSFQQSFDYNMYYLWCMVGGVILLFIMKGVAYIMNQPAVFEAARKEAATEREAQKRIQAAQTAAAEETQAAQLFHVITMDWAELRRASIEVEYEEPENLSDESAVEVFAAESEPEPSLEDRMKKAKKDEALVSVDLEVVKAELELARSRAREIALEIQYPRAEQENGESAS